MSRIWSIKLDAEIEQEVKNFIDEKFECTELRQEFPNLLLRKDVLDLLDKYCTVIYLSLIHI